MSRRTELTAAISREIRRQQVRTDAFDDTVTAALDPAPSTSRVGATLIGKSALRRLTSTTTGSEPSLRTVILRASGGLSTSWAGETDSATRGRSAPAAFVEGAGANSNAG